MKTKEQLLKKLNKKLDSYNRKARKYGYPTHWYDFKNNGIRGGSAMGSDYRDNKLPGILAFIYAIYLDHLGHNLVDICFKIQDLEFMKAKSNVNRPR